MKAGETICYYRARGGAKSVYVTMLYDKDCLRGSIIQSVKKETKGSLLMLEEERTEAFQTGFSA